MRHHRRRDRRLHLEWQEGHPLAAFREAVSGARTSPGHRHNVLQRAGRGDSPSPGASLPVRCRRHFGPSQQLITGRGRLGARLEHVQFVPAEVRHRAQRIMRMDHRASKLRTTLLLGTAFLAGVTIGPASGLIARHFVGSLGVNAALAQDTARANTYRLLTLFGDAFERVRSEYVDPVSDKELVENAINGMLTGLDPHSAYMNAEQFRAMQVETKGEFGGLGIEVIPENGFFKVISPMDDTPASKAGIKAGDIITGLNGKTTQGLSPDDALDQMRGPPNYKSHVDDQA